METDNQATAASQARIIKRYSNRKLYDTEDSCYVTLQQIGEMVRQGEDVRIIDNKTKEDKTEATLALIISEDLKSKSRSVPLGTLRTLIQERGGRLLSQLRVGPIGRLIPGAGEESEPGASPASSDAAATAPAEAGAEAASGAAQEPAAAAPAQPAKGRLNEIVDASRQTLDQLQATLDERVRTIVPGVVLIRELKDQVERLTQRVEQLEAQLSAEQPDSTSLDDPQT